MNAFVAAMAGATAGAGLWWTACALSRPGLAELLPTEEGEAVEASTRQGASGTGAGILARIGPPAERLGNDLAACSQDLDTYRAHQIVALLGAGTAAVLLVSLAALPEFPLTIPIALLLGAVLLASAVFAPALLLRYRAEHHRTQLRQATSAIADLTGIALAGGAGVSTALSSATRAGAGPAFTRIRHCLREADLRAHSPWDALAGLAHHTGVRELDDLAASLRLAGTDGARVRTSVQAKAATLRTRRLAALETRAHQATERMTLPVMLLILGFLLLMGHPAIVHVTTGF
ncbi:type II secretion system F family protein [Nocardiopsis changdeensis]|uniref:Type II secretion system F family protein n=1 Tax=Nocardiopsis changdeensis TaxID=2831969 RepID=A0ABX8BHP6_9ACTN|nr:MULTISPECIES: type II secretion system F family protein [Nocardiopsis]QUX20557.1 type II secretion system F family protein [Nocardiopsis changdeensis]QYX36488.1 type II secretion system F family protein [Nocardiopsis sp. MT53]